MMKTAKKSSSRLVVHFSLGESEGFKVQIYNQAPLEKEVFAQCANKSKVMSLLIKRRGRRRWGSGNYLKRRNEQVLNG